MMIPIYFKITSFPYTSFFWVFIDIFHESTYQSINKQNILIASTLCIRLFTNEKQHEKHLS